MRSTVVTIRVVNVIEDSSGTETAEDNDTTGYCYGRSIFRPGLSGNQTTTHAHVHAPAKKEAWLVCVTSRQWVWLHSSHAPWPSRISTGAFTNNHATLRTASSACSKYILVYIVRETSILLPRSFNNIHSYVYTACSSNHAWTATT